MRRLAWMGIVVLAGLGGVACDDASDDREVFVARLSGGEEVPARSTAASGFAQIIVEGNQISYAIEVDDITAITAAHIHAVGAAGVNAPVRLFLYPSRAGDPAPQFSTNGKAILVQATVDSSLVSGVTYDELLNAMRLGSAYVNVHTVQFPSGEIRGQLRRVDD